MSYSWDKADSPVFSGVLRRRRQRQWIAIVVVLALTILVGLSLIGRMLGESPPTAAAAPPTIAATPPSASTATTTSETPPPPAAAGGAGQSPPESSSSAGQTSPPPPSTDLIREPVLESSVSRTSPKQPALPGRPGETAPLAQPSSSSPASDPAVRAAAEVRRALQAWADAWSRRDFDGYQAAYVPAFKGSQASRQEWLQQRRARIVPLTRLQVTLTDIVIRVEGHRARVDFRQLYASEHWSDDTQRTIEMLKTPEGWRIAGESDR